MSASRSSLLFGGSEDSSTGLNEQVQGFRALLKSAASGYANALPVLVTFFTTGSSAIPVFIDHFSNLTVSDTDFSPLDVETARSLKEYMTVCETSRLQKMHGDHIYHDGSANRLLRPADSAFCFQHSSGGAWDLYFVINCYISYFDALCRNIK